MDILYAGPLWMGGTCLQRMETLKELGHHILPVDTEPVEARAKAERLICRVRRKLGRPLDLAAANRQIGRLLEQNDVQILWLDKALTIKPGILRFARERRPACVLAGYSPDDMTGNRSNQSIYFLKGLPCYDVFFTTKSYGVPELSRLGCRKVVFIGNAYDPMIHRPMSRNPENRTRFGGAVGFIGNYERPRARSILHLAENGVQVRVWGPGWRKRASWTIRPNRLVEGRAIWADDYATAISNFDINLAFLYKRNRDRQTQRSIEIPACGGFMLAERTHEHLELFEEGREAEFFSSDQELLDKIRYYLNHPDERLRIAEEGRRRCLRSGYSNRDRMGQMLRVIEELRVHSS